MLGDLRDAIAYGTVPARTVGVVRTLVALACLLKTVDLATAYVGIPAGTTPRGPLPADLGLALVALWGVSSLGLLLAVRPRLLAALLAVQGAFAVTLGGAYANHLVFITIVLGLLALAEIPDRSPVTAVAPLAALHLGDPAVRVPAWPVWLLQLHLCVVYLFAGLHKLNPGFLSGAAIVDLARDAVLLPARLPEPAWWLVAAVATVTVVWELTAPVGLWLPRTRTAYLVVGPVIHVGMLVVVADGWSQLVRLSVFLLAVLATYVPFLPTEPATDRLPVPTAPPARAPRWPM